MSQNPLQILVADPVWKVRKGDITQIMGERSFVRVSVDDVLSDRANPEVAFISRDVTGASTKYDIKPDTQRYYDALLKSDALKWVHVHSAGADRFVYIDLMKRGVSLTTSPGANASGVAQTTLAAILALARNLPALMQAQKEHRWQTLLALGVPPDLEGQTAVIVGWGPIGQTIGKVLQSLGVRIVVVRNTASPIDIADKVVSWDGFHDVLPEADWMVLACPLTKQTTNLMSREAFERIKRGAMIANVSRGAVVDEPAMIEKLQSGHLAGAYLDVFAAEPLPADSVLWDMPNVIATAHTASFSHGMYARMEQMFLDNLKRYVRAEPLVNVASP